MKALFIGLAGLVVAANSAELHPMFENGKWGYIDSLGKVVIRPEYDSATDFHDGLAVVSRARAYGVLDSSGAQVIPLQFAGLGRQFNEGLCPAGEGGKLGFIDVKGIFVVAPLFDDVSNYSEGVASVKRSGKRHYIDLRGNKSFEGEFDGAERFAGSLAAVRIGDLWGYVNHNGTIVIPLEYRSAREFSEGLAAVETADRKWGFINSRGQLVVSAKYDQVREYREGFAPVLRGNRWGFIDKSGTVVIPFRFLNAGTFGQGLAPVSTVETGVWGYIDHSGAMRIKPQFTGGGPFAGDGVAKVGLPDNRPRNGGPYGGTAEDVGWFGYIDKTGRLLWSYLPIPARR